MNETATRRRLVEENRFNGQLTARDLRIEAWLDRLAGAGVEHIQTRFGLGRSQAYRRLQVLQRFGLVHSLRLLADRPALFMTAGRSLRPASFEHTLLVARLVAERERAGRRTITETELRRERAGKLSFSDWVDDPDRQTALGCRRVPDAIEQLPSGGLRAFEIELSSKGKARREAVLGHYAASTYEQVTWLVPGRQLAALIRREIDGLGLARFMEVRDDW